MQLKAKPQRLSGHGPLYRTIKGTYKMSIKRSAVLALLVVIAASVFVNGCEEDSVKIETDWVEQSFMSMTEEQKVGQLFCITIDPFKYFLYPAYERNINILIGKYKFGAVYLTSDIDTVKMEIRIEFNGNKLHDQIVNMQHVSETPLLIAADFESGAWTWDNNATRFPFPLSLAASRSDEFAYRQGKITAVEARAQGINWLFSPNFDIGIPAENPHLQLLSFGNDPAIASELGIQYFKGCQEVGVAACGKYFPSETTNSLIDTSSDTMDPVQTDVFSAVSKEGIASILSSPVILDPDEAGDSGQMIPSVLSDILIERIGFDGIFVTDLRSKGTLETADRESDFVLLALKSGGEMFLLPETEGTTIPLIDFMVRETISDNIDITPIDTAVRRILETKYAFNIYHPDEKQTLKSMAGIGLPEYLQNSRDISNNSITLVKNDRNLLPIDYQNEYIISIAFIGEHSEHFSPIFDAELDKYNASAKHIDIFGIPDARIQYEAIRRADEADAVICSFFIKPDITGNTKTLSPEIVDLMKKIVAVNDKVVAVSYYDPHIINQLSDIQSYLVSFSPSHLSISSTLETIFGIRNARGRLPISISASFPLGHGLSMDMTED